MKTLITGSNGFIARNLIESLPGYEIVPCRRGDDLHGMERGAVGDVHERQARLGIAPGADPAPDGDVTLVAHRAEVALGAL